MKKQDGVETGPSGRALRNLFVAALLLATRLRCDAAESAPVLDGSATVGALYYSGHWSDAAGGNVRGVAIANGHYVLADGAGGVLIVRPGGSGGLEEIARFATQGEARGVTVSGTIAYVSCSSQGLLAVDISDPVQPSVLGVLPPPAGGEAYDTLSLGDGTACVSLGGAGLGVADVTDPARMKWLGIADTAGVAHAVAVTGNIACVADGPGGMVRVDLEQRSAPRVTGSRKTTSEALDVAAEGSYAYVADRFGGLEIYDISSSDNPVLAGAYAWVLGVSSVVLDQGYAFLADGVGGVKVIGVLNPYDPQLAGSMEVTGSALGLAKSDGLLAIACDTGFTYADASEPTFPIEMGSLEVHSDTTACASGSGLLVVGMAGHGIAILDAKQPDAPSLVSVVDTPGRALDVAVDGGYALVADGIAGVQMVDLRAPAASKIVGHLATPAAAVAVAVPAGSGSGPAWAVVAVGTSGIVMVDTHDPANLKSLARLDTPGIALAVSVAGSLIAVADDVKGVQIVDASQPSAPKIVGNFVTSSQAVGVALSGTRAYVACGAAGVVVLDVSVPASPRFVGVLDTVGDAVGVAAVGGRLAIADSSGGMIYVDAADGVPSGWTPAFFRSTDRVGAVCLAPTRAIAVLARSGIAVLEPWSERPTVGARPQDLVLVAGTPMALSITASGGRPLIFGWRRDGVQLRDDGRIQGANSPNLRIDPTWDSDTGSYRLVVQEGGLAVQSDAVNVRVDRRAQSLVAVPAGDQLLNQIGVTLDSKSSSGLPVVYRLISGPGALVGDRVTFLGTGEVIVSMEQPGDHIYAPATPVLDRFSILPAGSKSIVDWPGYLEGAVQRVFVENDTAYLGFPTPGVQIVDLTDKAHPRPLGGVKPPASMFGARPYRGRLFMACGNGGLQIADVSDKTKPRIIGQFRPDGSVEDVRVAGDYAYVIGGRIGLIAVDVRNPAQPVNAGAYSSGATFWGLDVLGSVAAVGSDTFLRAVSLEDPAQMKAKGTLTHVPACFAYSSQGLICGEVIQLAIYDPLLPGAVRALGTVPTYPPYMKSIKVEGTLVWGTDTDLGVQVLDVSDPTLPRRVGRFANANALAIAPMPGGYCCVAQTAGSLAILRWTAEEGFQTITSYRVAQLSGAVALVGNTAVLAHGTRGLEVVDVSQPSAPSLIGSFVGAFSLLSAQGSNVYAVDKSQSVQVISLVDPAKPTAIGSFAASSRIKGLLADGDRLLVARADGLQILDIGDPSQPTVLGVDPVASNRGVPSGKYIYSCAGTTLRVLDALDPTSPELVAEFTLPGTAVDIAIAGRLAVLALSERIVATLDIGEPGHPVLLGTYTTPGVPHSLELAGSKAFVAEEGFGLEALELSDPRAIRSLDRYQTSGSASSTALWRQFALVANGYWGLQIINRFGKDPFFISQPSGARVAPSGSVELHVEAFGAAPVTYQWLKDGKNLSNDGHLTGVDKATLSVSNATPQDVGAYSVMVSSSSGRIESRAAWLRVGQIVRPLRLAVSANQQPGGVTITVTGVSGQNYALETSETLTTWTSDATGQLPETGTVEIPFVTSGKRQLFIRAR